MDAADWISASLAIISLGIVVYKEFLEGPRLSSSLDQIGTLRLGGEQKKVLLLEVLLDDLLSDTPSAVASRLATDVPTLSSAIRSRDRHALGRDLVHFLSQPPGIKFDPTDDQIRPYVHDARFGFALYLPLIIANSGKRVGHVSTLLLTLHSDDEGKATYVFQAMAEIDPIRFLKRHEQQLDTERIGGVFAGLSIAPGASVTAHALMVPITSVKGRLISDRPLSAGRYRATVFGYGARNQQLFVAERVDYTLLEQHVIDALKGNESMNYLSSEDHIETALAASR